MPLLFGGHGAKKMNIEHRTLNIEWEKIGEREKGKEDRGKMTEGR